MCNQCLSPLTLWDRIPPRWGVLDTTLCDKVCQWFAPGTPVFSINETDLHDITEILLKVVLGAKNQTKCERLKIRKLEFSFKNVENECFTISMAITFSVIGNPHLHYLS